MACLLGIDSGLTVTKAVIFDEHGQVLAVARRRVPQLMPKPHHVERDPATLWRLTAEAVSEAIARSGRPPAEIAAIAATAHGDGLFLLDRAGAPLGNGILSLDSRAGSAVAAWQQGDKADRLLSLTGQLPHPPAPLLLLDWIRRNEPARFAAIGRFFFCKDWLTYCLTGVAGTDRTEASTGFTDVATQDYADEALALFDLSAIAGARPAMAASHAVIGHVTAEAARATGLAAGTPVVAGLHDVTASALGMGGLKAGVAAVVAGTYSINQALSTRPKTDPAWLCRSGIEAGTWNNMAISPASTANYDWFVERLCAADAALAEARGENLHERLAGEIDAALARPSSLLFHPYLFGSPHGSESSASFFGLHGWSDRGDMLRAVLEGIAFNHCHHVHALRDGFGLEAACLTGGVSRNRAFAQLFADALGLPVIVTETEEAAAWGVALCAGAGIGLFAAPTADPRDLDAISTTYRPDATRHAALVERQQLYTELAMALQPFWPKLEHLAEKDRA